MNKSNLIVEDEQDERIINLHNKIHSEVLTLIMVAIILHYMYNLIVFNTHTFIVLLVSICTIYSDLRLIFNQAYKFNRVSLIRNLSTIFILVDYVYNSIYVKSNILIIILLSLALTGIYIILLNLFYKKTKIV